MHPEEIVVTIAKGMLPNTYLELGVYKGETFNKVVPFTKKAIGVDVAPTKLNGLFFQMETSSFFEIFQEPVDLVFIDADHSYEAAKKDFLASLKLLAPNGVILLHDSDPNNDKLAAPGYCADSFKLVAELEKSNEVNIVTLPLFAPGMSIITRKRDTRTSLRTLK